ncbi:hypothetical protein D0463_17500, partial [Bacillus sp. V59.32b]
AGAGFGGGQSSMQSGFGGAQNIMQPGIAGTDAQQVRQEIARDLQNQGMMNGGSMSAGANGSSMMNQGSSMGYMQ